MNIIEINGLRQSGKTTAALTLARSLQIQLRGETIPFFLPTREAANWAERHRGSSGVRFLSASWADEDVERFGRKPVVFVDDWETLSESTKDRILAIRRTVVGRPDERLFLISSKVSL